MNKKSKAISGFTLVEILITVGVFSILTTVAALNIANVGRTQRFESDAQLIAGAIQFAQSKARLGDEGSTWGIRFESGGDGSGSYEVFSGSVYDAANVVKKESISDASEFTNPSPGSTKTILFSAVTGLPLSGDSVSIHERQLEGDVYVISVSSLGKISANKERGLVGMWEFDEGTGTSAYDASGNGNTGVLTGFNFSGSSDWISSGKSGGALSFDGSNDYVNVLNPVGMDGATVTVTGWIKTTTASTWKTLVARKMTTQGWSLLISSLHTLSIRLDTTAGADIKVNSPTPVLNDGNWHFIAGAINQSTQQQILYVDGVEVKVFGGAGTFNETGGSFVIMRSLFSSSYAAGQADDFRVYNRILSADEVKRIYEIY